MVLTAAGCGPPSGVEEGATVSIYVDETLCDAANAELARSGPEAGGVRLRAVCLAPTRRGGRVDLAAVGANARRATEDSAAVAYLAPPDPGANPYARAILDTAGIAMVTSPSGRRAAREVVEAIEGVEDRAALREELAEALG